MHPQAARYPFTTPQAGGHRVQAGAGRRGQRAGRQRVAQIVGPDQSGLDGGHAGRAMKFEAEPAVDALCVPGAKVAVAAEPQGGPLAQQVLPVIGKRRARGNHAHSAGRQRGHQDALLAGDVFHVAQLLKVRGRCVQHRADGRQRDFRQACDIAGPAGAEFKHGGVVRAGKIKQRQRQADFVVETAARGKHGLRAPLGAQNRGGQFLDRGLAVAPGHSDYGYVEAPAPGSGAVGQGAASVLDDDLRYVLGKRPAQDRAGSAAGNRRGKKVRAVEMLAPQCEEERAARLRAAVGAHARKVAVGAQQFAVHGGCPFRQAAADHRAAPG